MELFKGFNKPIDIFIDLNAIKSIASVDDAISCCRKVFKNAHDFSQQDTKNKKFIIVSQQDGLFGLKQSQLPTAFLGGLAGLIKSAQFEWPDCQCKFIDTYKPEDSNDAQDLGRRLSLECNNDFTHIEIGLTKDKSRVTTCLKKPTQNDQITQPIIDKQSIIIVTGGARGVTAACLLELAKHKPCTYILLGRSTLLEEPANLTHATTDNALKQQLIKNAKEQNQKITPKEINNQINRIKANREIKHTLAELEKLGATANYYAVDINDKNKLSHIIEAIQNDFGKVTGIIHGAGVLADKLIKDKTLEQFDRVYSTKVIGICNLLELIPVNQLKFINIFSSVAARYGNIGQSDYAVANESLNKLAQSLRQQHPQCLATAINWGAWKGGMVTETVEKEFLRRGIELIPIEKGVKSFVNSILKPMNEAEIVVGSPLSAINDQATISLSLTHFPYIKDHCINGKYVVPFTQIIQWFLDFLNNSKGSNKAFFCLKNIKLKKGIILNDENQTIDLLIKENLSNQELCLINNESGVTYYKCNFCKNGSFKNKEFSHTNLLNKLKSDETIYESRLFHTGVFQVIDEHYIDKTNKLALAKIMMTNDNAKLPIIFDAGLQLLRLFGIELIGEKTLPLNIGEVYINTNTISKKVFCRCVLNNHNQLKICGDLLFYDESLKIFAALNSVEMFITKNEATKNEV